MIHDYQKYRGYKLAGHFPSFHYPTNRGRSHTSSKDPHHEQGVHPGLQEAKKRRQLPEHNKARALSSEPDILRRGPDPRSQKRKPAISGREHGLRPVLQQLRRRVQQEQEIRGPREHPGGRLLRLLERDLGEQRQNHPQVRQEQAS